MSNSVQGTQGVIGQVGPTGAQGASGSGYTGSIGAQGTAGAAASIGYTGSIGAQGSIGVGVQGTTGDIGVQGTIGAQGTVGESIQGTTGSGSQGAIGSPGSQGLPGTGLQGTAGTPGVQGTTGDIGVQGSGGTDGTQGTIGAQGTIGTIGFTGVQGFAGAYAARGYTGSQGTQGTQGLQGLQGIDGNFGGATFSYTFKTDVTDSNPGAGNLQFNNASLLSSSTMFINDTDISSIDIQSFLRTIDDSTSIIKGHMRVSNRTDSNDFTLFTITGANIEVAGYHKVSISYVSGVTAFSDNEDIIVTFARTGTKGDIGYTGSQGIQGIQGIQGLQGTQGLQGDIGYTGSQGTQGIQGIQGTQGLQGTTGIQGTTGLRGYTGSGGAQGTTGTFTGSVSTHILPTTDITYDLGSSTHRFRSLYVSGDTIHLGAGTLKSSASGEIEMPAMKIGTGTNTVSLAVDSSGKMKKTATVGGVTQPTKDDVEEMGDLQNVSLAVTPESITLAVDNTDAGHGTNWKWSWKSGAIAYARSTITNQTQSSVPIYKGGTYTLFNFAAHELHGDLTQTHKIHLKWIEGGGTQNNVSWSVETLNVTNITFDGVNGGAATEVQRLVINVPSTITLPSLTAPTVSYNVAFANAGAYTFTGAMLGDNPNIGPMYKGGTYTFNLDSTLSGHPFYLTTDDGTNFVGGSYVGEYTSGVTGSRNESGTLVFVVPSDAPSTLYYQCGNHSAMRGTITIKDLAVQTNGSGNYVLAFQHTQEGHASEVEIKPVPALPNQVCLVYDTNTSKFIPQDLGIYLEQTSVFKERVKDAALEKITEKVSDATLTSLATVKANTTYSTSIYQQGDLAVHTGTARWYAPANLTVVDVIPKLGTAADAGVTLEIHKNGTKVSDIAIATGDLTVVVSGSNKTWAMNDGDYLTMDVTAIGTTAKGKDLVVQIKYRQT